MGWAELNPRDRGRIMRAIIVLVVLLGVISGLTFIAGLIGDRTDPALGTVMFPERGEAQASLLNNGDPVWVVRTADDVSIVLGAHSTFPTEEAVLVEWCPDAQAFIDLVSGSLWDVQGRHVAGPAPFDLEQYEFSEDDEGAAVLTGKAEPGRRSDGDVPEAACDAGLSTSFDP